MLGEWQRAHACARGSVDGIRQRRCDGARPRFADAAGGAVLGIMYDSVSGISAIDNMG